MSELKLASGEPCRVGDLALIDGKTMEVTGIGRTRVFMMEPGQPHHEPSFIARFGTLLRRAGEAEDRDREKYEYCEGDAVQNGFGWERVPGAVPNTEYRRLRKPTAAAPAKPPLGIMPERLWLETRLAEIAAAVDRYSEAGFPKPALWAAESAGLEAALRLSTSQLGSPAKPPFDPTFAPPGFVAKPCPDGHACVGCHFTSYANNGEECPPRCMAINRPDGQNAIFVKAEAPAKPPFEAVIWPVERGESGACYALSAAHEILAYIGNGMLGFTIAGFFRDQASAETFAEQYRREGRIGCGYCKTPMILGNPAKFCVATRSNA